MMERPELIDFIDFATGKLDVFKYSYSLLEYDDRKRSLPDVVEKKSKKPFVHRKVYDGRDPRSSFWWLNYVIDAGHT
jgi:hypothetical protein